MTNLCIYEVCLPEIRFEWPNAEETQHQSDSLHPMKKIRPDFVSLSAKKMALSEEELVMVFPNREYYLDVVHLSPRGHLMVAHHLAQKITENKP